jgi:hypothetical protein
MATYTPPVDQLLTIGWPEEDLDSEWLDYVAMGLTWEHAPELIRMMRDRSLEEAEELVPRVYAPNHAMRALAQIGHEKAAPAILALLAEEPDNEWADLEITPLALHFGPASLPVIEAEIAREGRRGPAMDLLGSIAESYPHTRDRAVEILTSKLRRAESASPTDNAILVAVLTDLKAIESVDAIRSAYEKGLVDEFFCGALDQVLFEIGASDTPPAKVFYDHLKHVKYAVPAPRPADIRTRAAEEKRRKDKKRKRQDQKKNRKRRK